MAGWHDNAIYMVLDHVFASADQGTNSYSVGLFKTAPTKSTTGAEIASGNGYTARKKVTFATGWTRANGTVTNDTDITFVCADASWSTVVAVGLFTQSTIASGTLMWFDTIAGTKVDVAETLKIAAGDFKVNIT
jgi:hypothetical protein